MFFLWIILYGLLYTLSEAVVRQMNAAAWLTPAAMAVYTGLLILWIIKTGCREQAGLTIPRFQQTGIGICLPLALLPLCNLLVSAPSLPTVSGALLMLCICTVEELFFRGFLLSFLERKTGRRGIFLSALLFSLFHCANLLSGWDGPYVFLQMLAAFAAGLYYGTVRLLCGSLIPCAAAHFLTNITAGDLFPISFSRELTVWGLCILLPLVCSFLHYPKIAVKKRRITHEALYRSRYGKYAFYHSHRCNRRRHLLSEDAGHQDPVPPQRRQGGGQHKPDPPGHFFR